MCWLRFNLARLGLALVLGLVPGFAPGLAFGQIVQERLGADGFPVTWKPDDFAVAGVSPSLAVSPSATARPSGVLQTQWDTDAVGVLKPGNGGVALDAWRKVTRAEADVALRRSLKNNLASPALKEAWRVLMLTAAAPPVMPERGVGTSWLSVRSEVLEKLGLHEAAWSLWRDVAVDDMGDDPASLMAWVKARMLAGEGEAACAVAKTQAAQAADGTEWAPMMAVCQLVGQGANAAAVHLSLQVVEPTLKARNPTLLRVLQAVTDGRTVGSLPSGAVRIDALGGAVLAHYPALMGAAIMPQVPDLALRRVVASEALPAEMRGQAALALAGQTGALADAGAAWQAVSATTLAGDLPDAVVVARGMGEASATYVKDYSEAALRLGLVEEAAPALAAWTLPEAAPLPEVKRLRQAQLALHALQGRVPDEVWDEWILAQTLENSQGAKAAQRTLLVVEGLGVAVPQRIWSQMRMRSVPVSVAVDPAWQRLLAEAVAGQNIPQVLFLVTEAWNGEPVAEVAPAVAGASVEALRRIGFNGVARRAAAEALLGLPRRPVVPLMPEGTAEARAGGIETVVLPAAAAAVSRTQVQGLSSVGLAPPVSASEGFVLPPPRTVPSGASIHKPSVTPPTKPLMPQVRN